MIRPTGMAVWVALGTAAVLCAALGFWWLTTGTAVEKPQLPVLGDDPKDPPKKSGFATDTVPVQGADVKFDTDRAMKYLKQLCDIGPRVSGGDGMRKQQELLEKHFKEHGATVTRQEFTARQRSRPRDPVAMTNLVISWFPDRARRVLLCCHYDTRPQADEERNRQNWTRPFLSANDGTGGVAMFMEMAHNMKGLKTEFGVDFVLFDGEEYVFDTHRTNPNGRGDDQYFLGSEHFAAEYAKGREKRPFRYEAGVLFDLCHAKGARLKLEANSVRMAPEVVRQVWTVAETVGAKSFKKEPGFNRDGGDGVLDDHLALNRVGIPCIDVIDFDYPQWHTLADTPDKVSPEQVAEVAKVMTTWIQTIR
jgi:hypothetical protein